jgi:hypothetical protein
MHPLHPHLASHAAKQRVASLLEEAEHDRQVGQARRTRRLRHRRRLPWALRAHAPRAIRQHAGAR